MSGSSRTILVADDDNDLRELVACSLKALEFDVVQAVDGAQALSMYQSISPDLLVLDGMMPSMTGMEVCAKVRSSPGGDIVPIIMLTGLSRLEDKVQGFSSGADDYLTKPFHYAELQARVRALLRIRDLTLDLQNKNIELQQMQQRIVEQGRQLAVTQLAGAAAHNLGQPLSAIILQCHLLESSLTLSTTDASHIEAIKQDAKRMSGLIESMQQVKASDAETYSQSESILKLDKKS